MEEAFTRMKHTTYVCATKRSACVSLQSFEMEKVSLNVSRRFVGTGLNAQICNQYNRKACIRFGRALIQLFMLAQIVEEM